MTLPPRTYLEMVWRSEVDRALEVMRTCEHSVLDYRPGTAFHTLWKDMLRHYVKFLLALEAVRDAAGIPVYEPLRARLHRWPTEKAA